MSKRALNRTGLGIVVVMCMCALSACWGADSTGADPGAVLRHSFSLSPGLVGAVTSCYEVHTNINDGHHKYLCRIVEGAEEAGQPGNWDVKFDSGDHPVASNCFDLFDNYRCMIVAPDGMSYEGCIPYQDNGTDVWWCDYKTHNWFPLYTYSDPWHYVLHTFWDWASVGVVNEASCAYGLVQLMALQGAMDNDWLASCLEGPI